MATAVTRPRRHLQTPAGCESHFTRRQAAIALGFASEFKIREFERRGLLHSVRGPMRAAFYPRAEVLALKAQLAQHEPGGSQSEAWSDSELLALLEHPKKSGQARTARDLVLETKISIERAERVLDFWRRHEPAPQPPSPAQAADKLATPACAPSKPDSQQERRGNQRLSRDSLIRNLRDPDPRVREQAFAQLRELNPR